MNVTYFIGHLAVSVIRQPQKPPKNQKKYTLISQQQPNNKYQILGLAFYTHFKPSIGFKK
jgi:hypothetical protein